MSAAGTRLLARAQVEGMARTDIDGTDLYALVGALAWLGDQPSFAPRRSSLRFYRERDPHESSEQRRQGGKRPRARR